MADEATATAPVDAPAPPPAAAAAAAATEEPQSTTQPNGEAAAPQENGDAEPVGTTADAQDADADADKPAATEGAATPGSKDKKRKSTGGSVSEHKGKKLNKKKSMPTLRLECKPGDYYWARLKGYPPWPAIICDEAMLPESLLATRPVSTARPDGSIRDDFKEGGKNAKERTFPIMFLATNEFQWMVNTNLTPLDPEECKNPTNSKMTKALQEAWKIASEGHDLKYFKDILKAWQEEEDQIREQEEEAQAEAERVAAEKAIKAEQAAKDEASKPKKKARKSKAADEDIDMEDVETPKSSSKKRKKDAESDGDSAKPKKTPKVTKLNAPKTTSDEASATKKAASKSKKKVVTAPKQQEEEDEAKPEPTDAEKRKNLESAVLYLRHRLQKGFITRDQAPQESEMAGMSDFIRQLEDYKNLDPAIIRNTKVHKVLKAIVKLATVPKDDEYHFKKRSAALLELWNKSMEADGRATAPSAEPKTKSPEVNGDSKTPAPADKDGEETKEGAENDMEKEEKEAKENADQIEQKVEGKKDAVADDLPPPVENAERKAAEAPDATAKEDAEMKDVPATA